ncbi:MAG: hypothetical protein ACR2NM_04790 [Bythopirellula sp.]
MDQVRTFLRVVWTQRFWVLGIIATIVSVVCWNMAAGDLQSEFSTRKNAIDGAYNAVNGIKNENPHPNDAVNEGVLRQAKQQRDYVRDVWKELYEDQRSKVLSWPASIGEEFVTYMENRRFRDSIKSDMRGFYHNYIENRFDALLDIVKAQKNTTGRAARGGYGGEFGGEFGGGQAATDEIAEADDFLVQWLDQGKVQQKLLFKSKPSSTQVWVTQEDLWVYETLLNVIADTNKARGATRPDNTAVRVIVELQVGSAASPKSTSKVYIPVPSEGAGMGGEFGGEFGGGEYGGYGGEFGGEYGGGEFGGEYGGMGGEYGGGMGGEYGGRGGFGGEFGGMGMEGGGEAALLMNRYLDADGNPDPGDGETVGSAEFRQLPIRMKLMMDQRWIPRILIECANAALPVEVKQLRINPHMSGGNFGTGSTANRSTGIRGLELEADVAEVEIRGVVYIYNPPATEQLTIPGDDEEIPSDDVAVN